MFVCCTTPLSFLWAAPNKVSPVALLFSLSLFFQWCASGSWIQASIRVLWVAVHWLSPGLVKFVNCIEGCHVFTGGRGAVNYSLSLEMQKTAEARERCYVGHFLLSHPLNRQSQGEGERESDRQSERVLNCSITIELRLGSPTGGILMTGSSRQDCCTFSLYILQIGAGCNFLS